MEQIAMIGLVLLYVGGMAFFLYYCVMADPATSPTARFIGYDLPEKIWSILGKIFGKKGMVVLEWITERALILLYIVVVFGSWSVIFACIYPWIASQTYVSQAHRVIGVFVFASCVMSWRFASMSSPGIITKETLHLYDHYPYDNYMFAPGGLCRTRHIPRIARSKFDRHKYGENVPRFDHFCGWLHNTIGECNYRWFLLFLLVHSGMCIYGTVVVGNLFMGVVYDQQLHTSVFFNRITGEEKRGSISIILQYLFARYMIESAVLLLMAVMGIALPLFLGYHIWLTSRGLTTNESFKWTEVQKWYKNELRRYEEAVNNGEVVDPGQGKPIVSDGDVTCTSGGQNDLNNGDGDHKADEFDADAIRHPGPKPVNIYNRGLRKNWEDVLFPIPLRKQKELAIKRKNL